MAELVTIQMTASEARRLQKWLEHDAPTAFPSLRRGLKDAGVTKASSVKCYHCSEQFASTGSDKGTVDVIAKHYITKHQYRDNPYGKSDTDGQVAAWNLWHLR